MAAGAALVRVAAYGGAHKLGCVRQRLGGDVGQVQHAGLVELRKVLLGLGQLRGDEVDSRVHARVGVGQLVQGRAALIHARLGRRQVARLQVEQRHVRAHVQQRRLHARLVRHLRNRTRQKRHGGAGLAQARRHRHRYVRQLQLVHALRKVRHKVREEAHEQVVPRRAKRGRSHNLLQLQRQLMPQPPRVQLRQLPERAGQLRARRLQLRDELRRSHGACPLRGETRTAAAHAAATEGVLTRHRRARGVEGRPSG